MSDEIDEIRRELEEVRRLKEQLKREIRELERERPTRHRRTIPTHHPKHVKVDLTGLTEGLDEMLEGIGEQIRQSLAGVGASIQVPRIMVKSRRGGRRRHHDVESIPPERVARVISPLGSEVRLRILDYLKDGGKSFNELESLTGLTGSSLTHHLSQLLDAGYVIKGEVRGTYYVTVEGRLAYRLSQWLTSRVERERNQTDETEEDEDERDGSRVDLAFDEEEDEEI